jgi:hypothetical protein
MQYSSVLLEYAGPHTANLEFLLQIAIYSDMQSFHDSMNQFHSNFIPISFQFHSNVIIVILRRIATFPIDNLQSNSKIAVHKRLLAFRSSSASDWNKSTSVSSAKENSLNSNVKTRCNFRVITMTRLTRKYVLNQRDEKKSIVVSENYSLLEAKSFQNLIDRSCLYAIQ